MVSSRSNREKRKCLCGSGLPRSRCDERVLVPCPGLLDPGEQDTPLVAELRADGIAGDCDGFFHLVCNAAKRCTRCRIERQRILDRLKHRRLRERDRPARELARLERARARQERHAAAEDQLYLELEQAGREVPG